MHCWFVLFVMEGVSGAEGEREVRCSGKDYSESISKLQCNQTKGDFTGARICYRKLVCWEQIEIHKKGGRHPIGQNVTSGNEVV